MTITTYCASSGQVPQKYIDAAHELGTLLAERSHILVNGAGRTGLMGTLTDACLAAGGEAVGVIPQFMIDHGWQHTAMSRLIVTADMHERKERMAQLSDACITLAGGVGTLEELLEIITWKQLGLYDRPIVLLNTDGYFDPLLAQLRRAIDERFMREMHDDLWCEAHTPEEALHLAETTPRWDTSLSKYAAIDLHESRP